MVNERPHAGSKQVIGVLSSTARAVGQFARPHDGHSTLMVFPQSIVCPFLEEAMPLQSNDETPRPVDWETIFDLMENAPPPKNDTAQTTRHGENNTQPAA